MQRAWGCWSAWHGTLRRVRTVSTRIITRWMNQGLCKSITEWRTVALNMVHLKNAASKVIARWQNAVVLGAWLKWIYVLNVTRKARLIILRWRRKFLFAAFTAWAAFGDSQHRCHEKCLRVIQRMTNRQLHVAFVCWVESFEADRLQQQQIEDMAASFMKIDRRLSLCRSFKGWSREAQSVLRFKAVARRIIARWNHMSLDVPFCTWQKTIDEK